ncbi:MAG: NAD-binding protein [Abditibacteriota bacterium]|nr:NAD-binding protein [Abditibacteriota bacterium]
MKKYNFILIVGGGHLGYHLAKELLEKEYEVIIIERDKTVADAIRKELGDVVVLGDGTDLGVLKMAGIERADLVVTTTGYDEDNFTIALMAKNQFKVNETFSRLRDPNNEEIFKLCGISQTVCSTSVILELLEQSIEKKSVIPIAALDKGNIEVLDLVLDQYSPSIGIKIRDLGLPLGVLIISVIRGDKSIIPKADTTLSLDDEIILLIPKGLGDEVQKFFVVND